MKIRIEQRELADAAKRAHRRLPASPVNPVLAGLLLEAAADGTVTLSGFDYETSTRAVLTAETLEPGDTLVSGRLLADVAAALPSGPVDLVTDGEALTATTPGNHFTLPVMARGDYPALPLAPANSGTVDGATLAAAVVNTAVAAMPFKDAVGTMEGFGGVHVAADGDQLTLSASDRYRIVRRTIPWTPGDQIGDGSLLIPAGDLAVTAKSLAGGDVRVAFPADGGGVATLAGGNLAVTSRCMAAAFPSLDNFFPNAEAATGSATFDAAALVAAVKRAALVNEDEAKPIRFTFDGTRAVVHGGSGGPSGSTEIEAADADGLDGFTIAFRPGYLTSLIAPIDGAVRLWLYTRTKPALIRPVDDDSYQAVLMPVRLT